MSTDCHPRGLTQEEERALVYWIEDKWGEDHSDAYGIFMVSHFAVFDRCARILPNYQGTIIIMMNHHNGVQMFSVHEGVDDVEVRLERKFMPV